MKDFVQGGGFGGSTIALCDITTAQHSKVCDSDSEQRNNQWAFHISEQFVVEQETLVENTEG